MSSKEEKLEQICIRTGMNRKNLDEMAMLMASTVGPIVIKTMIEHGFCKFPKLSKKSKIREKP